MLIIKVNIMLEQVYTQYIITFEKNDDIMDGLALCQDRLQAFFEKKQA